MIDEAQPQRSSNNERVLCHTSQTFLEKDIERIEFDNKDQYGDNEDFRWSVIIVVVSKATPDATNVPSHCAASNIGFVACLIGR